MDTTSSSKIRVILVGYPGSQRIVPACSFLCSKYLLRFPISFLNYEGPKEGWSAYVRERLAELDDELVILALDDYLLSGGLEPEQLDGIIGDASAVKLCNASKEENEEYPVTTQYTLWRRDFLMELLTHTNSPWHFEVEGSRIVKERGDKILFVPLLDYPTSSSLSPSWGNKVKVVGNKQEDIDELIGRKLLKRNGLIRF